MSLRQDQAKRLGEFSIALYESTGMMPFDVSLEKVAPDIDPASGWFKFLIPVANNHRESSISAVALVDLAAAPHVSQFVTLHTHTFRGKVGPASGRMATVLSAQSGESMRFDVYGNHIENDASLASALICISAGAHIDTPNGPQLIEDLKPRDLVNTFDNGAQPLRMVHARTLGFTQLASNRRHWPVCIQAGALGFGVPQRNLHISQKQRMLYQNEGISRAFPDAAVFVRAKSLAASFEQVYVDNSFTELTYYHLVFDKHETIFAEGAPTESFYPGPEGIANLDADARAELFSIFPNLRYGNESHKPDYPTVRSWELKTVVN